ncbi:MAG: 30S ribosomal protein S7 [Elusimicrobia bacterium]|nr:30S ribosomal protein S7 [Elusimicrobiota bacterium]
MSRKRNYADNRIVKKDAKYNSEAIEMLINKVMWGGKKTLATRIVYDAMDLAGERLKADPLETLENALSNIRPLLEVKSRRVGGATYQVPVEVSHRRALVLSIRWLVDISRAKKGKSMSESLAEELVAAVRNEGAAVRKKDEMHRMAEANKAFAHYRW